MPFDYFNVSHLAFGSKLTRAFRQLEKLCSDAESNINIYLNDLEYLGQFINRNYRVPAPNSPDSPVRAREIFDVFDDETVIKDISYNNGIFTVSLIYFNRGTDRFTVGQGSTTKKKGYACLKQSVSNMNPVNEITFVEDVMDVKGLLLFAYRIDGNGNVNIITDTVTALKMKPLGINHINHLAIGQKISLPYTAKDYEVILILGKRTNSNQRYSVDITLDGKRVTYMGATEKGYYVVYMKPEQQLKASQYDEAYKLIYSHKEV